MFAYGCCVGTSGKFESGLLPSLRRTAPSAPILALRGQDSIFKAYNELMQRAIDIPEVEGLVLVHDDVVIRSPNLESVLRTAFADGEVGLAGVIGGRVMREMSWWKCEHKVGAVEQRTVGVERYTEGEQPADLVDGMLLALPLSTCRDVRLRQGLIPRSTVMTRRSLAS